MDFFYKEQMEILNSSCPPDNYQQIEIECFRWVFNDIKNENNFKAQALKNPKILNAKSDAAKCECYALSFHNSELNSRKHFEYFLSQGTHVYKRLGTHIAKGKLEKSDGVSSDIDKIGHFNYHHIFNNEFQNKFEIISQL
jgi:hypothetical protein